MRSKMDRLRALSAERDRLLTELEKSTALADLVPGVFDAGPARVQFFGNVISRTQNVRCRIRTADDKETVLPLHRVPRVMWSERLVEDIKAAGPRGPYWKLLEEKNG